MPRSCSAPAAPLAVSYPAHGSDEEVLLREADAAPYQAKAAGRRPQLRALSRLSCSELAAARTGGYNGALPPVFIPS